MKIITFVLIAFLAGCVSSGVMVSDKQISQFKQGVTKESDIVAALGKPTSVTTYNGVRMISYTGVQAQARASSFIPIVGAFVGGSDSQVSSVIFKIGADGVLTDIISNQSAMGTGTGFAAGAPIATVQDQPRKPAE